MNYFLSGGAKNGKSSLAQRIVCAHPGPRYYLATMIPHDDEDLLRIRRHIDDRAGLGFTTVECGTDVLSALGRMDPGGEPGNNARRKNYEKTFIGPASVPGHGHRTCPDRIRGR